MNKLGDFIRNKRKNLALTQIEYADKIGITAVTLSKIENGEEIGSNVLKKLAEFTNISPKVLREMMLYEIKEVTKNIKTHQRYFVNEKRVPGTTTILGVLNKPALMYWAWDLGCQGIDYRKYTDEMAKIGTLVHERIEAHIKGSEVNFDDFTKTQITLSDVGFSKFLEWEQENKPIYIE